MKSSASQSVRSACLNLERLSRSFRLTRPGISPLVRLWNGFDSDTELFMYQTYCINYNVFCKQFDRNEHFPPFEHSLAAIRSASESIQLVQIVWAGLNSNWVQLMKSSVSKPGLRRQARSNAPLFLG